jgi:hypothetical protein
MQIGTCSSILTCANQVKNHRKNVIPKKKPKKPKKHYSSLKAKSREKLKPCKTINVSKVCALHT